MNAKEEKIKEAWGGFYNPRVNIETGWMDINSKTYSNDKFFDRLQFNDKRHSIRPKSLQGIENNNCWIRIESESDLPKEEIYCFFIKDNSICTGYYDSQLSRFYCGNQWMTRVSYYQQIVEPQPPIY